MKNIHFENTHNEGVSFNELVLCNIVYFGLAYFSVISNI